jgi:hypothetical protein
MLTFGYTQSDKIETDIMVDAQNKGGGWRQQYQNIVSTTPRNLMILLPPTTVPLATLFCASTIRN